MRQREISIEGGVRSMMGAQEAIAALRGVIAAQAVPGRSALRVWQGDEVSDDMLLSAARRSGAFVRLIR